MTKKDLVALADALRIHNRTADGRTEFTPDYLVVLADFCASQYPNFDRKGWIDCIAGECGQDDELIFAPEIAHPDGAIVEDNLVPQGEPAKQAIQRAARRSSIKSNAPRRRIHENPSRPE